jgi:tetratricopeptide (TPR) repeat protein
VSRVSQERGHIALAIRACTLLAAALAMALLSAPLAVMAAQTPQAGRHSSLPKTPEEREKALSDLYALLATADSEESAKAIADGIERVWLSSGSDTVDLLMGRAIKAIAEKKLELALKLLNHVVEQAPDFAEGWNQRAYVHFARNDLGRALGDLRRVLALDPNHFNSLDMFARILREIGQKKAALQAYRQLLDVYPFWPGARQATDELSREVEGQGI